MAPRLFHVSETFGIARFEPRPPPSPDAGVDCKAVWAVAESHLPNYLLPRDCPRICFRPGPGTSHADRGKFLIGSRRVIAFEAAWLERVRAGAVTVYDMPAQTFEEALPEAAYWISRAAVTPSSARRVDDLLGELASTGTEVRVLQDFWRLYDAVTGSSLQFSIIRKRNAQPRGG